MIAIVVLIVLFAAWFGYVTWLKHGVRPRVLHTRLPADQVRAVFVDKVARGGWQIVDDGNPLVAQSSLITGTRQQIGMSVRPTAGGVAVDIRPLRMRVKVITNVPTKGHTLRIRMNSFVNEVQRRDPALQLAGR
jgi:hypothetical protein